jgi:hypothetical protein
MHVILEELTPGFNRRSRPDPLEYRTLASLRDLVRAKHGRRRQCRVGRSASERPRIFLTFRPRTSRPGKYTLPSLFSSPLILLLAQLPTLDRLECFPNGYARTDARSLGAPARDATANPPARDVAPDCARRGPVAGCVARDGGIRTDGGVFARRRVEGRIRGVGRRARAPVVGRELECERSVKR